MWGSCGRRGDGTLGRVLVSGFWMMAILDQYMRRYSMTEMV
jgi:hypothetical protein